MTCFWVRPCQNEAPTQLARKASQIKARSSVGQVVVQPPQATERSLLKSKDMKVLCVWAEALARARGKRVMLDGAGGPLAVAGEQMGDGFAQDRFDRARRVAELGARLADREVARGKRDAHALGGAVGRPARDAIGDGFEHDRGELGDLAGHDD